METTLCEYFKILDKNTVVQRFSADKFHEVKIITDYDKGFQGLKLECILNPELKNLEYFSMHAFTKDESQLEEEIGPAYFF